MPLIGEYAPSTSDWARKQAELYESTDGEKGNTILGRPIILLYTLGAKSGKIRTTALMKVEHEGEYLVVASKGGAPDNPSWYYNLVDAPLVELKDGPVRKDYTPRELSGDERAVWWDRAVEAFPNYADYQVKTDRLIPIFLLTPVD